MTGGDASTRPRTTKEAMDTMPGKVMVPKAKERRAERIIKVEEQIGVVGRRRRKCLTM